VQGCVRRLEGNCLHFSACGGGVGWGGWVGGWGELRSVWMVGVWMDGLGTVQPR
jgi:hypothetical protein